MKARVLLSLIIFMFSSFLALTPLASENFFTFMWEFKIPANPFLFKETIGLLFASSVTMLFYRMTRNKNAYLIAAVFFLFLLSPQVYLSLLTGENAKFLLVFSVFVLSYFLLPRSETYTYLILLASMVFDPKAAIALFPLFIMAYFSDKLEYALLFASLSLAVCVFLFLQGEFTLNVELLPTALFSLASVSIVFPRKDKRDFAGFLATLPFVFTGSIYLAVPLLFVAADILLEEEKRPKAIAPVISAFVYMTLFLGLLSEKSLVLGVLFSLLFVFLGIVFRRKTTWHIFLGFIILLSILGLNKLDFHLLKALTPEEFARMKGMAYTGYFLHALLVANNGVGGILTLNGIQNPPTKTYLPYKGLFFYLPSNFFIIKDNIGINIYGNVKNISQLIKLNDKYALDCCLSYLDNWRRDEWGLYH